MRNPYKGWTAQQILDHYPHAIPQPDSEEARRARVGQRFRLYFLLDVDRQAETLGKKLASPTRQAKARALLARLETVHILMVAPQNAFLADRHGNYVAGLLASVRSLAS